MPAPLTDPGLGSFAERETPAMFRTLLDALPEAVFVKNATSKIIYMNEACEKLWGAPLAEIFMTDASALFPAHQMTAFLKKDESIFASGRAEIFEEPTWSASLNELRICRTRKIPKYDGNGKPDYLICVATDITEEVEARAERHQAHKTALVSLANLAEYRDTETSDHVLRVARLSYEIAREMCAAGLEEGTRREELLKHVGLASILHDVGKVGIPDNILLKPGRLTAEERQIMERQPSSAAGCSSGPIASSAAVNISPWRSISRKAITSGGTAPAIRAAAPHGRYR